VVLSGETLVDPAESRYPFMVLPAVVGKVEYQGEYSLVSLHADGQTLVSRSPPRPFHERQSVVAHLQLCSASWFDASTGRRLELHCQPETDEIA
jgi:hypothetical protein